MPNLRHLKAPAVLLAALALFCGGFFYGRSSEPEVTKTTERLEQRATSNEKLDVAIAEKKDEKKDEQKNIERTKTTTKRPDGTVVIEERSKDLSKTETKKVATKIEKVVVEKRVEVVKVEVHEKVVTRRPGWMIGVNAGVSVPALLGRQTPSYLPGLPAAAVVGVSVEKHLFWGIYGGVFVNTQGVIGLSGRGGF